MRCKINKRTLTLKQKRFCQEYPIDFNATKAAERAGYSKHTAYSIGQRLLKKVEIQNEIKKIVQRVTEKTEIKVEEIVKSLKSIIDLDIKDFLTWRTELIKIGEDFKTNEPIYEYQPVILIKEPAEVDGKMIAEITLSPGGKLSVKIPNKLNAIEKLMKHLGGYEKDNNQSRTDLHLYIEQASHRAEELAEKVLRQKETNNNA